MLLFYTQMAKICSTLNTVYEKQMERLERLERLDLTFGQIWSDLVNFNRVSPRVLKIEYTLC